MNLTKQFFHNWILICPLLLFFYNCGIELAEDLGNGYFFIQDSSIHNFLVRGEKMNNGIREDSILLSLNITSVRSYKDYLFVEKEVIDDPAVFDFAKDYFELSQNELNQLIKSEKQKTCDPCYYILDKRIGSMTAPLSKVEYSERREAIENMKK